MIRWWEINTSRISCATIRGVMAETKADTLFKNVPPCKELIPQVGKPTIQTSKLHVFYHDEFSQWYHSPFVDDRDGQHYNCAEQYMMAAKAKMFADATSLRIIMSARLPSVMKAQGRAVRGFDMAKWRVVALETVTRGNILKFSQDPRLAAMLLATDNRTIVEASAKDSVWGVGRAVDDPRALDPAKWKKGATNWLGMALMATRDHLRTLPQFAAVARPGLAAARPAAVAPLSFVVSKRKAAEASSVVGTDCTDDRCKKRQCIAKE